jgi:hypothetical protein
MVSPRERWKLNRTEPTGLELFEAIPEIRDIFIRGEWFDFICAFNGHHTGISLIFTQNFDGFQTKIGDITIHITEHFIVGACALPISGERWFKKGKLPAEVCNKFLVEEHQNPDWSQGIPILWLKEEWRGIMSAIQRYITGEGRFSIVHCYHIRFLMHLNGDKELNLPFYLLKILTKMSKRIQNYPRICS